MSAGWADHKARWTEEQINYAYRIWADSLDISQDLVCIACGAMGPFLFTYYPTEVHHQHTTNPLIPICTVCGLGTRFEAALAVKALHDELKACDVPEDDR